MSQAKLFAKPGASDPPFSAGALARLGGHVDTIQRLASMVVSELVAIDGLTEGQAMHAAAQSFIAAGAHTAVAAARGEGREPDHARWEASCDAAFCRAVDKRAGLEENLCVGARGAGPTEERDA